MLGCGYRQTRVLALQVDKHIVVARFECGGDHGVETLRPVKGGRLVVAFHHAKVVHNVAAAGDQHALVAQGGEALGQVVMKARRLGAVYAELDDRNVGLRIDVAQHRPGAVIEAPFAFIGYDVHRREQFADARGEDGVARCRVLHVKQRLWKAAEVMDGLGARHRRDRGAAGVPVRRDADNGARRCRALAQRIAPDSPGVGEAVVTEGDHGAAVAEENGRLAVFSACHCTRLLAGQWLESLARWPFPGDARAQPSSSASPPARWSCDQTPA